MGPGELRLALLRIAKGFNRKNGKSIMKLTNDEIRHIISTLPETAEKRNGIPR